MYTKEGEEMMERLWEETLGEQEAFGVRAALNGVRGK